MIARSQNRPLLLRRLMRDVVVVLLAEAVIVALAWCLSPRGRAALSRLFRRKAKQPSATVIDV